MRIKCGPWTKGPEVWKGGQVTVLHGEAGQRGHRPLLGTPSPPHAGGAMLGPRLGDRNHELQSCSRWGRVIMNKGDC